MNFKQITEKIAEKLSLFQNSNNNLYFSSADSDELWNLYISNFSKTENPVFRHPDFSEHECNNDRNFVKRFGKIISLKEGKIQTLFDDICDSNSKYYKSFEAMSNYLKSKEISNTFLIDSLSLEKMGFQEKFDKNFVLGFPIVYKTYKEEETYGRVEAGKVYTFHNFHGVLDSKFIVTNNSSSTLLSDKKANYNVFKRLLDEIELEIYTDAVSLINQESLLNSKSHLGTLNYIIEIKKQYNLISNDLDKNIFIWERINKYPQSVTRLRNTLFGELLDDMRYDLESAIIKYNQRIDPVNYKKAKSPISQTQIDMFTKYCSENGYNEECFQTEFANRSDIDVNNFLYINSLVKTKKQDLFSSLKPTKKTSSKSLPKDVNVIDINKFLELLYASEDKKLEILITNNLLNNVCYLTKAKGSKNIYKWNNNYNIVYSSGTSGKSFITKQVGDKGGNISSFFRTSLIWNKELINDNSDLDLHLVEPGSVKIYYGSGYNLQRGSKTQSPCSGNLDLDDRGSGGNNIRVENIFYNDKSKLKDGRYKITVENYSGTSYGFSIELFIEGKVYDYEYNKKLHTGDVVNICEVSYSNNDFDVIHNLDPVISESNLNTNGITTNNFYAVDLILNSPDKWGNDINLETGQLLFGLKDLKLDNKSYKGFNPDNLNSELVSHRKVIELISNKHLIEKEDDSFDILCGLGFNLESNIINKEVFTVKLDNKLLNIKI